MINNFGDLGPDSSVFVLNDQSSDQSNISDILVDKEDGETIQGGSFIGDEATEQDETRSEETGQDETGGEETGQDKTRGEETGQYKTRGDETGQDKTRGEETSQYKTRGEETSQDKTRGEETGQDKTSGQVSSLEYEMNKNSHGDGNVRKPDIVEKDHINLPKIWISKSASMEHDLD